ncbi:hypothetical protein FKP32DRAFT_16933 [Trametes sanguinea]|nr:hypothetical protein FKP32DRAFT_16933 [Trametes sanguinea]
MREIWPSARPWGLSHSHGPGSGSSLFWPSSPNSHFSENCSRPFPDSPRPSHVLPTSLSSSHDPHRPAQCTQSVSDFSAPAVTYSIVSNPPCIRRRPVMSSCDAPHHNRRMLSHLHMSICTNHLSCLAIVAVSASLSSLRARSYPNVLQTDVFSPPTPRLHSLHLTIQPLNDKNIWYTFRVLSTVVCIATHLHLCPPIVSFVQHSNCGLPHKRSLFPLLSDPTRSRSPAVLWRCCQMRHARGGPIAHPHSLSYSVLPVLSHPNHPPRGQPHALAGPVRPAGYIHAAPA